MHTPNTPITAAAPDWFDLARHDDDPDPATDPEPTPDPDADPDDTDPDPDDDPGDTDPPAKPKPKAPAKPGPTDDQGLNDRGKRAIDRMKAERDAEKRARLEAEKKVAEYEDRDKSDLEKATSKAERLQTIAAKATARAVNSEIRTAAAAFADPDDAAEVLMRSVDKYVDADGEIDLQAIENDLADLLERKPHWAKPAPAPAEPPAPAKPKAKPDPGQGQRPSAPPIDYRTASADEVNAYLASKGYRFRS